MNPLFSPYRTTIEDTNCYMAGLPGYPRNFSRDTIIAGIIAADRDLLQSQAEMSAWHQGTKSTPLTGEEPGKIHHEYPGVLVSDPYLTTYNACDTTALYLIGLELLQHLDSEAYETTRNSHVANIDAALEYLNHHIKDDIFWEFPPAGAERFALLATYWKDSAIPDVEGRAAQYPVAYALVQFQVARSLLAASRLLERADLADQADRMFRKGIETFMSTEHFCVVLSDMSRLEQPSSDELHALAYIPKQYHDLLPLKAIARRAETLMTPIGIACTPKVISDHLKDKYHGYVVWIFEQAMIHYGCQKFGLNGLVKTTLKCVSYISEGNELLAVSPAIKSIGNDRQLWSVAAKIYFSDQQSLRQTNWL